MNFDISFSVNVEKDLVLEICSHIHLEILGNQFNTIVFWLEMENGIFNCWSWNVYINILEPPFIEINFWDFNMVDCLEHVW
jgi:hypothetical protein